MLKLVVEFVGTFIFLSTILRYPTPLYIALSLALVIYLGGAISGGHFNPAVSFMMMLAGKLSQMDFLKYAGVQLAAGYAALMALNRF